MVSVQMVPRLRNVLLNRYLGWSLLLCRDTAPPSLSGITKATPGTRIRSVRHRACSLSRDKPSEIYQPNYPWLPPVEENISQSLTNNCRTFANERQRTMDDRRMDRRQPHKCHDHFQLWGWNWRWRRQLVEAYRIWYGKWRGASIFLAAKFDWMECLWYRDSQSFVSSCATYFGNSHDSEKWYTWTFCTE